MNKKNKDLKISDIEKMKKEVKNKQCAMDQDYSLIKKMVDMFDVDVYENKDVAIMKFDLIKKIIYQCVSLVCLE